jgi:hypothetical protein
MTYEEWNLRADPSAFSGVDRVVAMNLDHFDPLNSRDDLIKLLVETGISSTRPRESDLAAEDSNSGVEVTIKDDDAGSETTMSRRENRDGAVFARTRYPKIDG